ncbi:NF-X1-type zinc finger protein NFXL1-like [Ctenocephalides felis]|uniref:NF-X1-type zinc finger protein NFXL1-like n=1 Tax=Ctenocephalides felis TaxID=7515 RepID=UPI000E6E40D2|nr:NF-X1-type zinc finger protein NFXL1-like [Ctenocephalides felis]
MRRQERRNPWGTNTNKKPANLSLAKNAEKKFLESHQKLSAAIEKHVSYDESSEEEELESDKILDQVLKSYANIGGSSKDLGRTEVFLKEAFLSNAAICLICICSAKRTDKIWSCHGCYSVFHLTCIQRWANDNLFQQRNLQEEGIYNQEKATIQWSCPKCRLDYSSNEVPNKYTCFCGAVANPPPHPWLVPHSCGETCNKPFEPNCGHSCLLLCHPGPCPPCPKTIKVTCYCEQSNPIPIRCSVGRWNCTSKCQRLLSCKTHKCEKPCHEGKCPPCPKESLQKCLCGLQEVVRRCSEEFWQCENACNKNLSCGLHKCAQKCHSGDCDACPGTLPRECPCGKQLVTLACSEEVLPCGDTCGKLLLCGQHYCNQRCHRGDCSTCLVVIEKLCRCGSNSKELPCQKEHLCNTKCRKMRDCGNHVCNRKCCEGICPPCNKPCGRTLRCGQHKCESRCHKGPCFPCTIEATVSCKCGKTKVKVPCGREKKTRPPRCTHLCKLDPVCNHRSLVPHRCHMGPCPKCKLPCGNVLNCGHVCEVPCHTAVTVTENQVENPIGPWEAKQIAVLKALPCPPCTFPVPYSCLGEHESPDWPCHLTQGGRKSCGRVCGKALACGNHNCQIECHTLYDKDGIEVCIPCDKPCLLPQPEGCVHQCPRPCHVGPCRLCSVHVKRTCHCGLTQLYLRCGELFGRKVTEAERDKLLSCGNQCTKTYACGHRCQNNCHSGECQGADKCHKKVKLYCPCKRIKREFTCDKVRMKIAQVDCDDTCQEKKQNEEKLLHEQEVQRKLLEEMKNKTEVELFEKKFSGKRKYRQKAIYADEDSANSNWLKLMAISFAIISGVIAAILYVQNI